MSGIVLAAKYKRLQKIIDNEFDSLSRKTSSYFRNQQNNEQVVILDCSFFGVSRRIKHGHIRYSPGKYITLVKAYREAAKDYVANNHIKKVHSLNAFFSQAELEENQAAMPLKVRSFKTVALVDPDGRVNAIFIYGKSRGETVNYFQRAKKIDSVIRAGAKKKLDTPHLRSAFTNKNIELGHYVASDKDYIGSPLARKQAALAGTLKKSEANLAVLFGGNVPKDLESSLGVITSKINNVSKGVAGRHSVLTFGGRRFSKVQTLLNASFYKGVSDKGVEGFLKSKVVILGTQAKKHNQRLARGISTSIDDGSELKAAKSFERIRREYDEFTRNVAETIINQKGSPSIEELLYNKTKAALHGKKYNSRSSTTTSLRGKTIEGQKVQNSKTKTKVAIYDEPLAVDIPKEDTPVGGISLPELLEILKRRIKSEVINNMGTPALNYKSGRFANSVRVNSVSRSDNGMYTITYGYMTYPYQTFEPGYKQGSRARDPRALISSSIREIAADYIGAKFRTVRIGGTGSR